LNINCLGIDVFSRKMQRISPELRRQTLYLMLAGSREAGAAPPSAAAPGDEVRARCSGDRRTTSFLRHWTYSSRFGYQKQHK
jgi:hypothetical protein